MRSLSSFESGGADFADNASDLAARAASCALEVHRHLPDLRMAVATGRAETARRVPVGPAIDRAVALLRGGDPRREPIVLVDEVTAGLLGERFEVQLRANGGVLVGERTEIEPPRTLLGKPTPCVGREKELGLLEATLRECIDESVSRAVVVTAPAGRPRPW